MKKQGNKAIILLIAVFILMFREGRALSESATGDLEPTNKIEYKAEDLKDPFQPPLFTKEGLQEQLPQEEVRAAASVAPVLTIQGIVWGTGLPQAIINDKVLKIGDVIEEARIIDINKDGVVISFENQQYNLPSPAAVNLAVNLENFKK